MTFRRRKAVPSRFQIKVSMNSRFGSEKVGTATSELEVSRIPPPSLCLHWNRDGVDFFPVPDRNRVMRPSRVQLLGLCILATLLFAYLALRIWVWS